MPRIFVNQAHPQWRAVVELAGRPQGATAQEIAAALGHKSPKSLTSKLLGRMVEQRAIRPIQLKSGKRGPGPFIYISL